MTTPRMAVLAAVLTVALGRPAAAQTYTWSNTPVSGSWSTAANWDTLPPSGGSATAAIVLQGPNQTVTVQDRGNPFQLNSIGMDATATNGFSVTGNPLSFTGTNPTVRVDAGGTAAPLSINVPLQFSGASVIDIVSSVANAGSTYDLAILGRVSGSGTLTKGGTAPNGDTLFTVGNGTYTGTFANNVGFTFLGANNVFGRGTSVDTGANPNGGVTSNIGNAVQGAVLGGYSQQFAQLIGTGSLQVGNVNNTATVLTGFNNAAVTFAGVIQTANVGSAFGKVGTGTLTYTGGNTSYAGGLLVRDGILSVQGTGRFSNGTNPATGAQVFGGATLILNNGASAQADRLTNAGNLILSGGNVTVVGNSGTNISEITGPLLLQSGESVIEISQGTVGGAISGRGHRLRTLSLTQVDPTATLFLRATNLGATTVTGTGDVGGVTIDTAPTALLVGGGGAALSTTISILPFFTGAASSAATDASGFVTYVGTGTDTSGNARTRILADATEYAATLGLNATDNVSLAGAAAVATATTANSLRAAASLTLTNSLTLTSGAFLATGTSSVTGTGTLQFGGGVGGSAYVSVAGGATLSFATPVTAARLAKSGGGTLSVARPVTLGASPTVAVNAGTLSILNSVAGGTTGGFTAASGGITYQVSRGATLDVAGATNLTVGANSVLQGNGTVNGTLVIATGGTVVPSSLGGAATVTTSTGSLNTTGTVRFQGGGTYRWHVGSVSGGEYTQSVITGTGALDLTDATLTSANPFVVRPVSVTLQNAAGAVYDFDNTQSYEWTLGTFSSINGFAANKFTVNTSEFTNPLGTSVFSVAQVGNNLVLRFAPVPEPGLLLAAGVAGLAAAGRLRRRAVPA